MGTSYYRHDVGNGGINVVSGKYSVVDSNVVQSNHMGSLTLAAMRHNHMCSSRWVGSVASVASYA